MPLYRGSASAAITAPLIAHRAATVKVAPTVRREIASLLGPLPRNGPADCR